MQHPFAELIDLHLAEARSGFSRYSLKVDNKHLNPNGVVHGAALYALADTGMGTALYQTLSAGEICATIQITMNYFKPVHSGVVVCISELVNRGKTIANLESKLFLNEVLIGAANGNFSIFKPSSRAG